MISYKEDGTRRSSEGDGMGRKFLSPKIGRQMISKTENQEVTV